MSAIFVAGDTSDCLTTPAPVSAYPLSISIWIKAADVTGGYTAASLVDTATNADWWRVEARGDVGGDPARWDVRGTGTGSPADTAASSTSYTANTWHHVLCVSSSDSSHTVYLDGGGKITITTQINPQSVDQLAIGVLNRASPVNWFDGKLAEVAVWDVALGDADAVTLAGGAVASSVSGADCLFYADLRSNAVDLIAAATITNNGSVAFDAGDHPPVSSGPAIAILAHHLRTQGIS
jgi:hypothetical protein